MTVKEAIAAMRAGHAVRREGWTDDLYPQMHPDDPGDIRDHLYMKIDGKGEDLRRCFGTKSRKRFDGVLTSEDIHATDWVVYRPGIGCKTCKCKG